MKLAAVLSRQLLLQTHPGKRPRYSDAAGTAIADTGGVFSDGGLSSPVSRLSSTSDNSFSEAYDTLGTRAIAK